MLSLKNVLSLGDYCETMVFDEIDVGVGGRIAEVYWRENCRIIETKTNFKRHPFSPNCEYMANTHFKVIKNEGEDNVTSTIEELNENTRVGEIARMITGKEITEASIKHAAEFLARR